MIPYTIYIVDDEQTIREGTALVLEQTYTVRTFDAAEPAIKAIIREPPDLVLLDIGLPGMDGIRALEEIKAHRPETLVIMITAYEDSRSIIQAMKLGAYDYIIKPVIMDGLEHTIANALETIRLRKEVQLLQEAALEEHLPMLIAQSDALHDIVDLVERVAASPDTPVLVLGDTGTGKELIASAIHYRSPNFKGPFVPVNCAAIPQHLLESELFGYERGAFSGAAPGGKSGLIEQAEGGTLFLDEVGELSCEAQAKMLRFLEEGTFYRVGSTRSRSVRTRVVSATNRDLVAMMEEGTFRPDLYYRIGVVAIRVPSLNERPADIIPLAEHFLAAFSKKFNRPMNGIVGEVAEALIAYPWKGNVRELRNLIERAVLVCRGDTITLADLGLCPSDGILPCRQPRLRSLCETIPPEGVDLVGLLKEIERHYLDEAYTRARGNECQAARMLHMNHHTYRYHRRQIG